MALFEGGASAFVKGTMTALAAKYGTAQIRRALQGSGASQAAMGAIRKKVC
ncbi:hypothetical protein IFO70_30940 [Phormidium tenue FACHB-886]|nr:hypothetical protein [Phormidium tenue FACHB-886]